MNGFRRTVLRTVYPLFGIAEVNKINRQKFLTELAKLLSFMYEEDRQRALSMYERMFDITEDEQALIQHLMSPTRQAVIIARAYDAKERKLSVASQSRGDLGEPMDDEVPNFVLAINRVFDDLFPDAELSPEDDQVTFFDLGVTETDEFSEVRPKVPAGAVLLSDTQKFRVDSPDLLSDADDNPNPGDEFFASEEEIPAPDTPDDAAGAPAGFSADDASIDELISSWGSNPDAEAPFAVSASEVFADASEEALAEDALMVEEAAEEGFDADVAAASMPEETDSIQAMPDFSADEFPADEDLPPEEDSAQSVPDADAEAQEPVVGNADAAGRMSSSPVKRTLSVPKLILFLVIAIPVTLVLLALLLVPVLLFFGIAVGLIALGATLAVSAFSGFSVLADLLLLLGAALISFAVGLLFLWLAIWVVVSGMIGLVRSVRRLGGRMCTKEVSAQ